MQERPGVQKSIATEQNTEKEAHPNDTPYIDTANNTHHSYKQATFVPGEEETTPS